MNIPSISSCHIRPTLIDSTDYLAISLKIKILNNRGKGYWKMNNSLLHDTIYKQIIETLITSTTTQLSKNHNPHNSQTIRELLKCNIKDKTIKYLISKNSKANSRLTDLENELKTLSDNTN